VNKTYLVQGPRGECAPPGCIRRPRCRTCATVQPLARLVVQVMLSVKCPSRAELVSAGGPPPPPDALPAASAVPRGCTVGSVAVQKQWSDVEWKEIAARNRCPAAQCVQSTAHSPHWPITSPETLRSDGDPRSDNVRTTHTYVTRAEISAEKGAFERISLQTHVLGSRCRRGWVCLLSDALLITTRPRYAGFRVGEWSIGAVALGVRTVGAGSSGDGGVSVGAGRGWVSTSGTGGGCDG
jgi:hypothetical protein